MILPFHPTAHDKPQVPRGGLSGSGVLPFRTDTGPTPRAPSIGRALLDLQRKNHQRWALRIMANPEAQTYADLWKAAAIIRDGNPDNPLRQRVNQTMRHLGLVQ